MYKEASKEAPSESADSPESANEDTKERKDDDVIDAEFTDK